MMHWLNIAALLVYLLEQDIIDGAIVLRMDPERPAETEVVVARTRDEIVEAKGSKYCPGKSGVGLRAVPQAQMKSFLVFCTVVTPKSTYVATGKL